MVLHAHEMMNNGKTYKITRILPRYSFKTHSPTFISPLLNLPIFMNITNASEFSHAVEGSLIQHTDELLAASS